MTDLCGKKAVHRAMSLFLGLLLVCGLTMPLLAQFTTARLGGTVLDPSGLALAGATVTVQDELTTYRQETTTNNSGEYLFPVLPVGKYQITVSMTGFVAYQPVVQVWVPETKTDVIHRDSS